MRISMSILMGLLLILPFGCTRKSDTPSVIEQTDVVEQSSTEALDLSEVPPEAKAILEKLSRWHAEELDVAECPEKYPGRIVSGETNAWISTRKEKLKKLGFIAKWNCDTEEYELFEIEH